ncbi:D-altritol 5-dehydrogenase-like isoform X2 [Neocloeon triangulifer]|uniref:D-altritol 5-dehydrogenase-like isoform X2 n=1 Tax=Neocloeon triangulifer TaxID=2078957 RepID=UPI00286EE8B2|nr:D-altritol 5-dehydrogenase-like isoform X2 [Neocloeon triangulifer]
MSPHTAIQFDYGTKKLTFGEVTKPELSRPDEILVKVAYSGICGTDLHVIHGQFPCKKTAFSLGHEFSGVVQAVGKEVTYLSVGDRVVVDPNSGCGHCASCWNASYHRCENVRTIGILTDGGWAEFCLARKGQVYKLPDSVTLKQGALCEPMSCIAHGWSRLGAVPHNSKILILGAGIIGNLWACLFHLNGHRGNVTISEPQETRRKLVEKLELGYTLTSPTDLAATNPEFDLVVDCSGFAPAMQQAFQWIKMGGKMMIFGVANPTAVMEVSPYDIMKKELTILGALTNPFTFPEAIAILEMMGPRYLDYDRLGVKSFPLSGYEEAMRNLEKATVAKAVFEINPEK